MKKFLLYFVLPLFCVGIISIFACYAIVTNYAKDRLYSDVQEIPEREFGLLLGTSPQSRVTRAKNYFFQYRIDAAVELYKARKIKSILISGDECSLDSINEVQAMMDSLVARGVHPDDIFLDGKGYDTRLSVIRASNAYDIKSYTVISQPFHNERAIYLAEHLGLDTQDVIGFNAKNPQSARSLITYAREYLARVKMFMNILFHEQEDISDYEPITNQNEEDFYEYYGIPVNTVFAHDERDTIVGNFTGKGIDTLYVIKEDVEEYGVDSIVETKYYINSNNPGIPRQELYGCPICQPRLVLEGDLDGNGTDEVGYLHTWVTSQWRVYRIFTLIKGKWRYLIEGEFLITDEGFRSRDEEVAQPGPKKGRILIKYGRLTDNGYEIHDTIVRPTYSEIWD